MTLIEEVRAARTLPPPSTAKFIRVAAGVAQTRLARELGVSRVTLARWESGTMRPRMAQRVRWARALQEIQKAAA